MAATANMEIQGTVTGLPGGDKNFGPSYLTNATGVGEKHYILLLSGDNTIPVPSGAKFCLVTPPAANAVVLKEKGAGGDTGITISLTLAYVRTFPASPGTWIINAASDTLAVTEFNFG